MRPTQVQTPASPKVPWCLPGMIPDFRDSSKPWSLPGVAPTKIERKESGADVECNFEVLMSTTSQ